jgi:hypothetical protein
MDRKIFEMRDKAFGPLKEEGATRKELTVMKKSKMLKRVGAVSLSTVVMLGMSTTAMAASLSEGEIGGGNSFKTDNPTVQTKTINIEKELTVYNPTEATIYAPAITYTYSLAPASGTELVTVTDEASDHASNLATTVTVLPGVTDNATLTGTGTGVIAWTNAETVTAAPNGYANIKNLAVSFENVVFTEPGVYRYKISETPSAYITSGVTDGTITSTRYLDVYVMRSANFNPEHDGTTGHEFVAGDWSIYGYVCINLESVTGNAGGTTNVTPATAKTNGFVSTDPDGDPATNDGATADEYYTYNATISKVLSGDPTMENHKFPCSCNNYC